MAKFNVGDIIRCIRDDDPYEEGYEGVVTVVEPPEYAGCMSFKVGTTWMDEDCWELVARAPQAPSIDLEGLKEDLKRAAKGEFAIPADAEGEVELAAHILETYFGISFTPAQTIPAKFSDEDGELV